MSTADPVSGCWSQIAEGVPAVEPSEAQPGLATPSGA